MRNSQKSKSKHAKMDDFSLALLEEYLQLKAKKLNIKFLADQQFVSRAWVYKYFGSTEAEILTTAIDCLTSQITELLKSSGNAKTPKQWSRSFLKGLDQTLLEVEKYPALFRFYIHSFAIPNSFTERLKHHQDLYIQQRVIPQIKTVFGYNDEEASEFAKMLFSLRMGLVLSWLPETNKTKITRLKLIRSIKVYIFDRLDITE